MQARAQHHQLPVSRAPAELEQKNFERFERYRRSSQKNETMCEEYLHGGRRRRASSPTALPPASPRTPSTRPAQQGIKVGHDPAHHPLALPGEGALARPRRQRQSLPVRGNEHGPDGARMSRLAISVQTARSRFCGRAGGMIPTPAEVLAKIQEIAEGGANAWQSYLKNPMP